MCKDEKFYTCADNHGSIFSLSDRDEHRERRKVLAPKFSKQAAEKTAPRVRTRLVELLRFMSAQPEGCNITDLFRTVAVPLTQPALLRSTADGTRSTGWPKHCWEIAATWWSIRLASRTCSRTLTAFLP